MAKAAYLTTPRTDWNAVARDISARLSKTSGGKIYSGQYVREIASGWRSHSSIGPLLKSMGLLDAPAAPDAPVSSRSRRAVAA